MCGSQCHVPPPTTGGPLSISQELSQAFNLVGGRKVSVRRVEQEEVGLDLMELRFKVVYSVLCMCQLGQ